MATAKVKVPGFGGTVIQVVVHHIASKQNVSFGFGGTVNQAVVHLLDGAHVTLLVSEIP